MIVKSQDIRIQVKFNGGMGGEIASSSKLLNSVSFNNLIIFYYLIEIDSLKMILRKSQMSG